MTIAHFVFAILTTGYILTAIQLEERDLKTHFGMEYRNYANDVPMIIPFSRRKKWYNPEARPSQTRIR